MKADEMKALGMNVHIKALFLFIGLLFSCPVWAQTLAVEVDKAWGPDTLIERNSEVGVFQLETGGHNEPGFLSAPLQLDGFYRVNLYFDIKINRMENLSGFEIRLGDEGFNNYYALRIPTYSDPYFNIIQDHYWQTYSFSLSDAIVVGHPELRTTRIGFYIQDNGKGPLKVSLDNVKLKPAPQKGYASLTFDDGYVDHYYAAKIMRKYALSGTAYIMPRQIGEPGYLSMRQLKKLKDKYHWGISAHHAVPYTDFTPVDLINEINYTIDFLDAGGFASSAHHLAYPMGRQDRKVVLPAVREYFETARVASGGVETLPPADPHLLRTINVLDTTKPEELAETVKQAVNNGQWAILMFHHFVEKPKSSIDYRKKDFEKFIALIAAANVPVLPVHEVYSKFKSSKAAHVTANGE